ncbi:protein unc-45 homolog B [Phalaenopsis equestris]|uniref:protein unc-45 homolog B n=1 Tax=Phalaenopsis equestris TaxID=78828 RepID=UPI0009E2E22F|nr:protein unc-45 homolog B [Phalaenopsis equestris]
MEMETALNKIERAHRMYRELKHRDALELYTEALGMAKNKSQKIALHSNRAACYLKLHDFKKAAQECTSVLDLDQQHTGALMLRAQTLVTLKDYQSALFDVNRLMELNPASDVYRNLQDRLRTQLSLAPIPESEDESSYHDEDENIESTALNNVKKTNKAALISPHPTVMETRKPETPTHSNPQGWEAIPKPKGHSGLDYSRWDKVEEDSSGEEEDDAEEQRPQYRFRVRTVGVRPVK